MNANELADLIGMCGDGGYNQDAAKMLRQQQAEIEALKMGFANSGTHDSELAETRAMAGRLFLEIQALKQIIDANNLSQNIGQFVKPTNEPVAWMHQNPDYAISKHKSLEYNIPLYTHPVKEDVGHNFNIVSLQLQQKAQEK
jgi:hypothetical protein